MPAPSRTTVSVLSMPIDAVSWDAALERIHNWASKRESRYVCATNVHAIITARHNRKFESVIREADMCTPDGAPIVWVMRKLGCPAQERINGPDLMLRYCQYAADRKESIYLLGSTLETLMKLKDVLLRNFPGLEVAGLCSPPFRRLSAEEDEEIVREINASGATTL